MRLQTARRLKLENFLYWSLTLGTFNSLILRLDWKYTELEVNGFVIGLLQFEIELRIPRVFQRLLAQSPTRPSVGRVG